MLRISILLLVIFVGALAIELSSKSLQGSWFDVAAKVPEKKRNFKCAKLLIATPASNFTMKSATLEAVYIAYNLTSKLFDVYQGGFVEHDSQQGSQYMGTVLSKNGKPVNASALSKGRSKLLHFVPVPSQNASIDSISSSPDTNASSSSLEMVLLHLPRHDNQLHVLSRRQKVSDAEIAHAVGVAAELGGINRADVKPIDQNVEECSELYKQGGVDQLEQLFFATRMNIKTLPEAIPQVQLNSSNMQEEGVSPGPGGRPASIEALRIAHQMRSPEHQALSQPQQQRPQALQQPQQQRPQAVQQPPSQQQPNIRPVEGVVPILQDEEIAKTDGKWYQVGVSGHILNTLQRGCRCGVHLSRKIGDQFAAMRGTCINSTDNSLVSADYIQHRIAPSIAVATFVGGQLKEAPSPQLREVPIVAVARGVADDWVLLYSPVFRALWVYSRTPVISDAHWNALNRFLQLNMPQQDQTQQQREGPLVQSDLVRLAYNPQECDPALAQLGFSEARFASDIKSVFMPALSRLLQRLQAFQQQQQQQQFQQQQQGFQQPQAGFQQGFQQPQAGFQQGFQQPQAGFQQGFQQPQAGFQLGFQQPQAGFQQGFQRPAFLQEQPGSQQPRPDQQQQPGFDQRRQPMGEFQPLRSEHHTAGITQPGAEVIHMSEQPQQQQQQQQQPSIQALMAENRPSPSPTAEFFQHRALQQPIQQPIQQQPIQQQPIQQQPMQQPIQQPIQQQPIQQPFQQPLQQPIQQPIQQPFQQPLQQPIQLQQPFQQQPIQQQSFPQQQPIQQPIQQQPIQQQPFQQQPLQQPIQQQSFPQQQPILQQQPLQQQQRLDMNLLNGDWLLDLVTTDTNETLGTCGCAASSHQAVGNTLNFVWSCANQTIGAVSSMRGSMVQAPGQEGNFRIMSVSSSPEPTTPEQDLRIRSASLVLLAAGNNFNLWFSPERRHVWLLTRPQQPLNSPTQSALFDVLRRVGISRDDLARPARNLASCRALGIDLAPFAFHFGGSLGGSSSLSSSSIGPSGIAQAASEGQPLTAAPISPITPVATSTVVPTSTVPTSTVVPATTSPLVPTSPAISTTPAFGTPAVATGAAVITPGPEVPVGTVTPSATVVSDSDTVPAAPAIATPAAPVAAPGTAVVSPGPVVDADQPVGGVRTGTIVQEPHFAGVPRTTAGIGTRPSVVGPTAPIVHRSVERVAPVSRLPPVTHVGTIGRVSGPGTGRVGTVGGIDRTIDRTGADVVSASEGQSLPSAATITASSPDARSNATSPAPRAPPTSPKPAPESSSDNNATTNFDLRIISGLYFEQAVSKTGIDAYEKGCNCSTANITVPDNSTMIIDYKCRNGSSILRAVVEHRRNETNPGIFRATLKEREPQSRELQQTEAKDVIFVGADEEVIVFAEPAIKSVWIFSKPAQLNKNKLNRVIDFLQNLEMAENLVVRNDTSQCSKEM